MLRHHIFSDRKGHYTGLAVTGGKKKQTYAQVADLANQGFALKEIASRLDLSYGYTTHICRTLNIETVRPASPRNLDISERDRELIAYFLEGRTLAETGLRFGGISRERVRQILAANGIMARGLGKKIKPLKKPKPTEAEKFWNLVDKTPGHGPKGDCWLWKKPPNAHPYGRMTFRGNKAMGAHIISWLLGNRKLTPKQWILHRCDIMRCVNPDHLYEGTPKDNARDRDARGRGK